VTTDQLQAHLLSVDCLDLVLHPALKADVRIRQFGFRAGHLVCADVFKHVVDYD